MVARKGAHEMSRRQKSAKEKLALLKHIGIKDPTLADVTRLMAKKGRKK